MIAGVRRGHAKRIQKVVSAGRPFCMTCGRAIPTNIPTSARSWSPAELTLTGRLKTAPMPMPSSYAAGGAPGGLQSRSASDKPL